MPLPLVEVEKGDLLWSWGMLEEAAERYSAASTAVAHAAATQKDADQVAVWEVTVLSRCAALLVEQGQYSTAADVCQQVCVRASQHTLSLSHTHTLSLTHTLTHELQLQLRVSRTLSVQFRVAIQNLRGETVCLPETHARVDTVLETVPPEAYSDNGVCCPPRPDGGEGD
jgi:hypothetical protein